MKDAEKIVEREKLLNSDEVEEILVSDPSDGAAPQQKEENVVEVPKERPGEILKRTREAQGLSLDIVHEATKIPMDALRAIEEGYKIRMLSPFYYKGFVKIYADYLGIDIVEVIEDYRKEELPEHIDRDVDELEIPGWILKIFTKKRKQKIVIGIGIILVLFLSFKIIGFFMSRKLKPSTVKRSAQTVPVKKKAAKKKGTKAVSKSTPVRKAASKKAEPKSAERVVTKVKTPRRAEPVKSISVVPASFIHKDVSLTVRSKQNSWLRVKADGQVVFQSVLRTGAVETWFADNEIEISGNNINKLEFELNGKMIGTLGRNDRNAKKVVVTKRGLSVKR